MNAAVITETRHFDPQIIRDHLSMLPDDFELVVFCSEANKRLFNEFDCEKYIVSINNLNDYNRLLTSTFFWDKLQQYDRVLIFQTDSKILRKGIEEFYEYNYYGAPWKFQENGGNGGISLRNPQISLETIKETPYHPGLGFEDVYFSNHMPNVAPRSECKKFSCETIFELGTFATHAIKNYMTNEQIKEIENQYR